MKFKIDENLPEETARTFCHAGHDALTIHDEQMVGYPDSKVALFCQAEQRILVTLDLDFADIRAYPPGAHPGIIVLRPRSHSKPSVLNLVNRLIPLLTSEALGGKLWIAQEDGLRIREK